MRGEVRKLPKLVRREVYERERRRARRHVGQDKGEEAEFSG